MSSERFVRSVTFVIGNEIIDEQHVESNNPKDKGRFTRYGITEKTAARHRLDVRRLTLNQARMIYFLDYWDHAFDLITDEVLATKVFDFGVNAGPQTARRYLQRAANDLGAGLMVDGSLGSVSIAAINALDPSRLLLRFAQRVYEGHYLAIVANNPVQACFLNGWRNRLSEVPIFEAQDV